MGELHLDIIVDRMKREFKVEANVGKSAGGLPRNHSQERRSRRQVRASQSGGRGQYGHVKIAWSRWRRAVATNFETKIVGGVVPREYINSQSTRASRSR